MTMAKPHPSGTPWASPKVAGRKEFEPWNVTGEESSDNLETTVSLQVLQFF